MSCSCSCCCCMSQSSELLDGIRKKERLVREEEEEAGGGGGEEEEEEEENRRTMDLSVLREQYRSTRDRQRRQTQVLLFRKVSEELSDAVSIIPVAQGLTSSSPPSLTFDPDPASYDPWHIHLCLHRRSCPGVTVRPPASSPETTNTNSSSRCSSSSSCEALSYQQGQSESRFRKLSVGSTSDSLIEGSRGEPDSERSRGEPFSSSKADLVQVFVSESLDASEQNLSDRSREDPPNDSQASSAPGSLTSSDESSTPVASITCSPRSSATNLLEDLKENRATDVKTSNHVQQTTGITAWGGYRKSSAPALKFTRQRSVGGVGSSSGVHQSQNYYPFPNRKTPRISEAARRLGMYSSF